jgi:hypothetical protein
MPAITQDELRLQQAMLDGATRDELWALVNSVSAFNLAFLSQNIVYTRLRAYASRSSKPKIALQFVEEFAHSNVTFARKMCAFFFVCLSGEP